MFDAVEHLHPQSRERRFDYARGAPTVVLLHGLTATPHQYDGLAPLLHARGCNVLVPRLPKHGYRNRMTSALAKLEISELIAAVKVALREAKELGGEVTLAGFSLGGLLAAYAAQREEDVQRVVCIAPFFGIGWWPNALNRRGAEVLRYIPDLFLWWNPLERDRDGNRDGYPRYPISAIRKAYKLGEAVFEDARVRRPCARSIVLVTNPHETSCHNGLARDLLQLWRGHGADAREVQLQGMPRLHDFMTPRPGQKSERVRERVYPVLVDVILSA